MVLLHLITSLAGALLLAVVATYSAVTLCATLIFRFWHVRRAPSLRRPPVTLLKPLCGTEPDLYLNLRSFCLQDYPAYQIVFGVRDAADPAIAVVRRLMQEFPALLMELAVNDAEHGSNRKVSNLINMLPYARHELLIIADSDTRVRADYLDAVTQPLLDPEVGMVTCIYRCVPVGGIWSRLGSMYINDWYMPSVLLAWLFGHRGYASGQTMALRRETLDAVGGLQAVANQLADDHRLAESVRRIGQRVVLSRYLLETVQSEPSAADLMIHELRWMRTIRVLAGWSFNLLFVSFTLPLLGIGVALTAAEARLTWPLIALVSLTLACRIGLSSLARLGQTRIPLADLWLLPVRDLLLCWIWSRALFTTRVSWRGSDYEVDRQGVLRAALNPVPD
jgi:ceramide glucosyltransferase